MRTYSSVLKAAFVVIALASCVEFSSTEKPAETEPDVAATDGGDVQETPDPGPAADIPDVAPDEGPDTNPDDVADANDVTDASDLGQDVPDTSACQGMDRPEGCPCSATSNCAKDLQCTSGTCSACTWGTADCPCDMGQCSVGLVCDTSGSDPQCKACPAGTDGCPCEAGDTPCGDGLVCEAETCVACTPGELDCQCADDCTCEGGAVCDTDEDSCGESCACVECPVGSDGCGCDTGEACDNGLTCQAGVCSPSKCEADPNSEGCPCGAGCDSGLYCNGTTCAACEPGKGVGCLCHAEGTCDGSDVVCKDGVCEDCVPGADGCACGVDPACTSPGFVCSKGKCCAAGTVGCQCEGDAKACKVPAVCNIMNGLCENCDEGAAGCACPADTPCGDTLTCLEQKCVPCAGNEGKLGCACSAGKTCDAGLTCDESGSPTCVACVDGAKGCPCGTGCGTNLTCEGGSCVDCIWGVDGCPCKDGDSPCDNPNAFCNDSNMCQACELGDIGCKCTEANVCNAGGKCVAGNCVACSPGDTDASCGVCAGTDEAFVQVEGVCYDCQNSCAEVVDGQPTGWTGAVWPTPTGEDRCICETKPGWFIDQAKLTVARPCDADGDGWVDVTVRPILEGAADALKTNARCEPRVVTAFKLVTESGAETEVALSGLGGPGSYTLYEEVWADNDEALLAALVDPDLDVEMFPTAGEPRPPTAAELNGLAKYCVSATADFNGNGQPDLEEDQQEEPADIQTHFSYFAALHYGYYEDGLYTIAEKSRLSVVEQPASKLPATYDPPCMEGEPCWDDINLCKSSPYPHDAAWWRECTRFPDVRFQAETLGKGMDFAEWSVGDFYPGMTHHSQFKCIKLEDVPTPGDPIEVSVADYGASYVLNRCEFLTGDEAFAPPTGDPKNPSVSAIECAPSSGSSGQVTWAAVKYTGYATANGYQMGCVNECVETRENGKGAVIASTSYQSEAMDWAQEPPKLSEPVYACYRDELAPDNCCEADDINFGRMLTCRAAESVFQTGEDEFQECGGLHLVGGHIGTVGGGPSCAGGLCIIDAGFEYVGTSCAGGLCVTGGLTP